MTPLLTRLRRFTADTVDDDIYIPRNFIESVQNNTKFKQLKDDNEWLQRIDKDLSDSDLSILRHAFLMDGHNFMNTLSQFLHTVKWQEFFAHTCTQAVSKMPILIHMLLMAWRDSLGTKDIPEPMGKAFEDSLGNLNGSRFFDSGCVEAIRSRYCDPKRPRVGCTIERSVLKGRLGGSWREFKIPEVEYLNQLYETVKKEKGHSVGMEIGTATVPNFLIAAVEIDILRIDSTQPDDMTFGQNVPSDAGEPDCLLSSSRWTVIGRNLCRLGLRVGADVPRWSGQPKPTTVIMALQAVINNEGPAVSIMLSRLERYQVQIQKQQQVITALQFRHLMEHLPIGVRDQWLASASKTDGVSEASRWDRMKEVEKWNEFWIESVKQIFRSYMEDGAEAWEGSKGHEPSPFAHLLKHHLIRAGEKNNERDAVHLLAHETDVGERVKRLYSTLSQIIHQYSDADFEVNKLNFSPLDARILTALIPKNIKKKVSDDEDERIPLDEKSEIIAWKEEFRRYVWENVTPAASMQTRAKPSKKSLLDNATFDDAKFVSTITAKFTLAKKHISSCNRIHHTVLAAVFDAIGRMSLLAAGRCVANGRLGLTIESSFVATAGDHIHVTGHMALDEQDQSISSTEVYTKAADGTMVASGSFKAGEVRETKDGEAHDNMI
ncbi:uncharacterized protein FIESC28_01650 [Fusarium coffeatum]|uniref:Uncharacterized protein n=1 Tax=Fusarium coffeatum TaxID=231269 RepID=A0A366S8M1_9HYPO|nr:uncharacterized protein FIESC28_01650 [Fusarium coffeatum]RBR25687.1 hypothetical protein FIESC28_01650 [Fusarium coffeatum]